MTDTKTDTVSEEMVKQAKKSVEKVNADRANKTDPSDFSQPRRKRGGNSGQISESDMLFPEMDFDEYGPTAWGASTDNLEVTGSTDTQEFFLDAAKLKHLPVMAPGTNLPKKRLYTVKALHRDGRLVQLGAELQIQNNAGGDPEDMIGLRRYQRKGLHVLIDFETGTPWYCAAWGCFAKALTDGRFVGFCDERHAKHTLPNAYKNAGQIMAGLMEQGVTTSRTWSA
jgi:hypothetical protein